MERYEILIEFEHYNGTVEGVCQQDGSQNVWYYYLADEVDIESNEPRTYVLEHLLSDPTKRSVLRITEQQLHR